MQGKEWTIGTPKTQASFRNIDIGKQLIEILKTHRKRQLENKLFYGQYYTENNFICTKEDGKLTTPHIIKHYGDKARRESGIDFTFHSLRHTHTTLLLENGAIDKAIQERLGHARIGTTMDTYSHLTNKTKKRDCRNFREYLPEIAKNCLPPNFNVGKWQAKSLFKTIFKSETLSYQHLLIIQVQNCHKGFLWYLDISDVLHTFLTCFLFLQEFLTTGDISTVQFSCYIFSIGFNS